MNELTDKIYENIAVNTADSSDENKTIELLLEVKRRYESAKSSTIEDYLSEIQDIDAILGRQELRGITDATYPSGVGPYTRVHTQGALRLIKKSIKEILGSGISTIQHHRKFCKAVQYGLRQGRVGHPINYFILNYDTLIEDALALEGVSFNDGFVGGATAWWDSSRFSGEEKALGGNRPLEARLFKLHGSIDWIKTEEHDFPMRIRKTLPEWEVIGSGEPVVIYPASVKYKETQYDPFSQMMTRFRHYLSSTEDHVLAILGYGFGDEHINADIADSIKRSKGGLSVVIFLGGSTMPQTLASWVDNPLLNKNILIFEKSGVWQDGEKIFHSEEEIDWYKFEIVAEMLSKGMS